MVIPPNAPQQIVGRERGSVFVNLTRPAMLE
jgi:hypothetical protein